MTWEKAVRLAGLIPLPQPLKLYLAQIIPHRPRGKLHLHGDEVLIDVVTKLIRRFYVLDLIETGTYIGDTAYFFSITFQNINVWTCEINKQFYRISANRLRGLSNAHLFNLDSELFLGQILPKLSDSTKLYWLDAHWNDHLPLQNELAIIGADNRPGIVVIDDFWVPGQPQFGFDEYPGGKRIGMEYIRPYITLRHPWTLLPKYHCHGLTPFGGLRGHAILFQNIEEHDVLTFAKDEVVLKNYTIFRPMRHVAGKGLGK